MIEAPTRPEAAVPPPAILCGECREFEAIDNGRYVRHCTRCWSACRDATTRAKVALKQAYPGLPLMQTLARWAIPRNWRTLDRDDPEAFALARLRSATDAELLTISMLGPVVLTKIRARIPYEPPPGAVPEDVHPVVVRLQQALSHFRAGDMAAAEPMFVDILRDDPGNADGLHLLGLVAEKRGDLEMAAQLIDRSVQLKPHSRSWLNLGVVKQHRGQLDAAIAAYRTALSLEPDYADAWLNLLFALDMHPHATPELLLAERQRFDAAACARFTAMAPPHLNDRTPDRTLRIGYVSGDFRATHSAASSFSFISDHSRDGFEVYLYSTFAGDDPTAERFKARADVWCEIGHLTPFELAKVIYDDQIDILVDLGGAAQGNRAQTFMLRPAPIQVGGWGYPHGLGIAAMDYMVADPVSVPPEHASTYPERLLMLPCLMAYRHDGPMPDVADCAPQELRGYRTYGYLGRAIKLNAPTLALWAEILRAAPTGRLLLKSDQYGDRMIRSMVVDGLGALGVDASRIEIRGMTSRYDHLAAHNDVDVCLDPMPCGSGQTVLDSCLMGVPTVTLPGAWVSGRITASVLTKLGWSTLVARSRQDYVSLAQEAFGNRPWLRKKLLGSVIMDGPSYAQAVEVAFRDCWHRYLEDA